MWPYPPETQNPAPSTRTQAPVPSTRNPIQPTEPTSPTGWVTTSPIKNNGNYEPAACKKENPKQSKLNKMRREKNMQQMKEQGKNPPDQTNEEELGRRPEKEFRVMTVKMIQNLGNRMEKLQEMFSKDLEELKSKQTMMNNTINEIKNSIDRKSTRLNSSH